MAIIHLHGVSLGSESLFFFMLKFGSAQVVPSQLPASAQQPAGEEWSDKQKVVSYRTSEASPKEIRIGQSSLLYSFHHLPWPRTFSASGIPPSCSTCKYNCTHVVVIAVFLDNTAPAGTETVGVTYEIRVACNEIVGFYILLITRLTWQKSLCYGGEAQMAKKINRIMLWVGEPKKSLVSPLLSVLFNVIRNFDVLLN